MAISFIRTLLLYAVILSAVRLMGKRQISELQTSELVVTMLISDIAAIPMQDAGQPLLSGLLPIAVLVACEILASFLMLKSERFRKLVCGSPIVVISHGKIMQSELKRLRMTTQDLCEELRQKDVFSLGDVDYAIIETNGRMSVIKKPEKEQPSAEQLGLKPQGTGIEAVVISDGALSEEALRMVHKSRQWVLQILQKQNLSQKEVFIMTANSSGLIQIIKKEGQKT